MLHETKGFNTKSHRDLRGFKKTKKKLDNVWEAHCVDSHSLVEIATGTEINDYIKTVPEPIQSDRNAFSNHALRYLNNFGNTNAPESKVLKEILLDANPFKIVEDLYKIPEFEKFDPWDVLNQLSDYQKLFI